ncbi:hypothetical protein B0A50_05868 [Salinomyces thailandicus]|uniref:Phosphoglycerate mutase n=1 Tax=Salinomyces thailandicus TaxID=706561 RepID=A0A4U0TSM2_9PEZI|nr:hypothetical protein B0A50_05868 [Salinomyces thailandica]
MSARAKALRQWLRAQSEIEVVVVSHGAILDYIVEDKLDEDGVLQGPISGWDNGEWRFNHSDHRQIGRIRRITTATIR